MFQLIITTFLLSAWEVQDLGGNMEHIQRLEMALLEMENLFCNVSTLPFPFSSFRQLCGLGQKLPTIPFPLGLGVQLCCLGV